MAQSTCLAEKNQRARDINLGFNARSRECSGEYSRCLADARTIPIAQRASALKQCADQKKSCTEAAWAWRKEALAQSEAQYRECLSGQTQAPCPVGYTKSSALVCPTCTGVTKQYHPERGDCARCIGQCQPQNEPCPTGYTKVPELQCQQCPGVTRELHPQRADCARCVGQCQQQPEPCPTGYTKASELQCVQCVGVTRELHPQRQDCARCVGQCQDNGGNGGNGGSGNGGSGGGNGSGGQSSGTTIFSDWAWCVARFPNDTAKQNQCLEDLKKKTDLASAAVAGTGAGFGTALVIAMLLAFGYFLYKRRKT